MKGEPGVRLELEIPDEATLLSDFIFDLDWVEPDLSEPQGEKSIQATIWEIRGDQVRSYRRFVSR